MKILFVILLGLTLNNLQKDLVYKSDKWKYKLSYPNEFKVTKSKDPNVDFFVIDGYGGSILVNILPKNQPMSYESVTKVSLENELKKSAKNTKITQFSEKVIGGCKSKFSYLEVSSGKTKIKQIFCLVYNKNYVAAISMSSIPENFKYDEIKYLKTINSIEFYK